MLPLAIPIALQNLLSASFRLVDTLMIGRLGDTAIASVGLAGNVSFLVELVGFGLASGSSVFMAQYHGAGNDKGIRKSYACAILCGLPIAIIAVALALNFPTELMRIITDEAPLISEGSNYLRYCSFSYIGIILGLVTAATLRSTENVRLPVISSCISAVLNAILNYGLIFGQFGFPELGVSGAGLATSISSLANPIIMLSVSYFQRNILRAPIREFIQIRDFIAPYLRRVFPVLCNEIFWSLSVVGMNMVFGRMGGDNYAALTVYRTIENVVFVFFVGICNACNILVGMHIGAQKIEEAKSLAKQFLLFVPILGAILGIITFALRVPILSLFDMTESARSTAMLLILIFAFDVGPRNIPYLTVVGIFRAGGDTKIGLMGDLLVNYGLVLPCAIVAGLVLELPFVLTYLLTLIADDLVKCIIYLPYFFKMKWISPID